MGGGAAAQGVFSERLLGREAVRTLPQDPKRPGRLCGCGVAMSWSDEATRWARFWRKTR